MTERVCCSYINTLSARLRVCCLYRVSTAKQVDRNEQNQADIPVQRKACHEFAEKMGWTIVREEQEAGVSGFKVSAYDRDKIQLIRDEALKGSFDILLVFMFDRLGRRESETPFVVEWFVNHGIQVWSVKEGEQRFDAHVDHLTNYIRYWQASGESKKTSIRTKTALGQMVREGRYRGGSVPYGYRLKPSGIFNKRKHEVNKLEINEEEAKVIRMMFNLCVGWGYGRNKIANLVSAQGLKTRTGENWHEATVGHILHNITYTGVLRSGESRSDVIPELQIIDQDTFDKAQQIMEQRINENKENRTIPLNTSGQSLLSGNVFCGHCGGRLTLTTNGTVRTNAAGERIGRKRIRYVCYNKTRHRTECDGQTGYTMHILDGIVTELLHQIFDKMKAVTEEELVQRAQNNIVRHIKEELVIAKRNFAKATKDYEGVKAKMLAVINGECNLPEDTLSEMVEESKQKIQTASERISALNAELPEYIRRETEIRKECQDICKWSELFDSSDMAVKKMVASYLIKRIYVYSDYQLRVEFNIDFDQFELGLEIPNQHEQRTTSA